MTDEYKSLDDLPAQLMSLYGTQDLTAVQKDPMYAVLLKKLAAMTLAEQIEQLSVAKKQLVKTVVMCIGPPGSGKDSVSLGLLKELKKGVYVSQDGSLEKRNKTSDPSAYKYFREDVQDALAKNDFIVIGKCHHTPSIRKDSRKMVASKTRTTKLLYACFYHSDGFKVFYDTCVNSALKRKSHPNFPHQTDDMDGDQILATKTKIESLMEKFVTPALLLGKDELAGARICMLDRKESLDTLVARLALFVQDESLSDVLAYQLLKFVS